jgi:hypothetical protein
VGGAVEVVDDDRATNADLVSQQESIAQLRVEVAVMADVLTRMRLAGVDEEPRQLRMASGGVVEQRTLR